MRKFWAWRTLHLRADIEAESEEEAMDIATDLADNEFELVDCSSGVEEYTPEKLRK